MKHIKSYENLNVLDILKKYAVWEWDKSQIKRFDYDIIEIISEDKDLIWCKNLYNCVNNKITGADLTQDSFSKKKYIHQILYTSDNLEECLDYVKMLYTAFKYNL